MKELFFFIGYDPREDIAYRVCKHSLKKRATREKSTASEDTFDAIVISSIIIPYLF